MDQTYLMPMAKNLITKQTVKSQDLSGYRFRQDQRSEALLVADQLAAQLSERTGDNWQPLLRPYNIPR